MKLLRRGFFKALFAAPFVAKAAAEVAPEFATAAIKIGESLTIRRPQVYTGLRGIVAEATLEQFKLNMAISQQINRNFHAEYVKDLQFYSGDTWETPFGSWKVPLPKQMTLCDAPKLTFAGGYEREDDEEEDYWD